MNKYLKFLMKDTSSYLGSWFFLKPRSSLENEYPEENACIYCESEIKGKTKQEETKLAYRD